VREITRQFADTLERELDSRDQQLTDYQVALAAARKQVSFYCEEYEKAIFLVADLQGRVGFYEKGEVSDREFDALVTASKQAIEALDSGIYFCDYHPHTKKLMQDALEALKKAVLSDNTGK
jgi:hypothetical protein